MPWTTPGRQLQMPSLLLEAKLWWGLVYITAGFLTLWATYESHYRAESEEIRITYLRELSCMCGSPGKKLWWHVTVPVLHQGQPTMDNADELCLCMTNWHQPQRLSRVRGVPETHAGHPILLHGYLQLRMPQHILGLGGRCQRRKKGVSFSLCIAVHLNSNVFIQRLKESYLIFKPHKMQRTINKYHRIIKIIHSTKLFWKKLVWITSSLKLRKHCGFKYSILSAKQIGPGQMSKSKKWDH